MAEAAEALPAPDQPRRARIGAPPFVPTQEARNVVSIMAALGASHDVMLQILARNGVPCRSRTTLRKAFREELKQAHENLITTLGLRMVHMATTDGPHSFSACAFLLRSRGGPAWRIPKGQSDADLHAAAAAGMDGVNDVQIVIPHNFRDRAPEDAVIEEPPNALIELPPVDMGAQQPNEPQQNEGEGEG
jgi:hypothetical protein